ncbi:MAG: hypothetical protein M0041_06095 [Nitrospiraceae bacterium]|nr:hypothetical protein [Nitrospiraceae bacterium]
MESPKIGQNRRGNAGKGRPPGSPNKIPASVKEMVLQALRNVGGDEYLERQAIENPAAFMGLIGKLLPTEIKSEPTVVFKLINAIPIEDEPEALS